MHDADARHLYVDVAEPLAERALVTARQVDGDETSEPWPDGSGREAQHSGIPRPGADLARAQHRRGRGRAREGAALRLPGRRHLREPRRGRARPLQPRPRRRPLPRRAVAPPDAGGAVRRGAAPRGLRLARAAARGDPVPPPRPPPPRRPRRRPSRGRLASFADLRVGDYVVHEDHGIARFAGFETKTVAGVTRDYLELEYRGEDRVFAPTDQLAKISRYVGAGGDAPQLSALGAKRWEAVKARARRAARELAGELLNLYAERQARRGPRLRARRRVADASSSARSPTARPPTRSTRSRRSRATWSPSGRWTG